MRFQTVFAFVRAWILGLGFVLPILDSIPHLDPPSTFYGARIPASRTYMDGKHSTLNRRASALDPAPSTPSTWRIMGPSTQVNHEDDWSYLMGFRGYVF